MQLLSGKLYNFINQKLSIVRVRLLRRLDRLLNLHLLLIFVFVLLNALGHVFLQLSKNVLIKLEQIEFKFVLFVRQIILSYVRKYNWKNSNFLFIGQLIQDLVVERQGVARDVRRRLIL